jgi:hypothetical protein
MFCAKNYVQIILWQEIVTCILVLGVNNNNFSIFDGLTAIAYLYRPYRAKLYEFHCVVTGEITLKFEDFSQP